MPTLTMDIEAMIAQKRPEWQQNRSGWMYKIIIHMLERFLFQEPINALFQQHSTKTGMALVEEIFDHLDFSYLLSSRDKTRIPAEGRLIIVANHPLGALDGLSVLHAVRSVRPDVKIVVNDLLLQIKNLADCFLPFDVFSQRPQKANLAAIEESLKREEAVIFFPAGEVSRLSLKGIHDRRWFRGPVHLARKFHAPILPVFIKGRNSALFYLISFLNKNLSMVLLPREAFKKRHKTIVLKIGDLIPAKAFVHSSLEPRAETRLLKKHLGRIALDKKGLYKTEKTVVHPVERRRLKSELERAERLGTTHDGKEILILSGSNSPNLLLELARLRELTFRKVGEGTGGRMDSDGYDSYYHHLILWNPNELEIMGAYRLGIGTKIISASGSHSFYSATFFEYGDSLVRILPKAAELGRSFIQEKYWNSRALDSLWQGIGAYLAAHPEIQYLFGPVSISGNYAPEAQDMIVHFYRQWYGGPAGFAIPKSPYTLQVFDEAELNSLFPGQNYRVEYQTLKTALKKFHCSVPILYKHYSDLSEAGGVRFLDFAVDAGFQNCVDGLILVDLTLLSPAKRARYIPQRSES